MEKWNEVDDLNINNRIKNFIKSKDGSAMVTVVVIVAFISVIATVLLYMVGSNYRMKIADVQTKQSFYGAEEVLEALQTQLIIDASNASQKAYNEMIADYSYYAGVSKQIVGAPVGSDISDLQREMSDFQHRYNEKFSEYFYDEYTSKFVYVSGTDLNYATTINNLFPGAVFDHIDAGVVYFTFNGMMVSIDQFDYDLAYDKNQAEIKAIEITAVSEAGYTSKIRTKFQVYPPTIDVNFQKKGDFFKDKIEDCIFYSNWEKL